MSQSTKPKIATVVGGGAFGTAMAQLLGRQGIETKMWVMEEHVRKSINEFHENSSFLPGCPLAENITAYGDLMEAVKDTELVLLVIPTPFFRRFLVANRSNFPVGIPLVLCSKGIENDTLDTPFEIARDELPGKYSNYICCISGPSFAKEVALGQPTSVTCASESSEVAHKVQGFMSDKLFRVYVSDDLIGSEIAGACKNVLAIGNIIEPLFFVIIKFTDN
eukprot:Awhi_evm1s2062